jgi:fatty-acid desaturase
MIPQIHQKSLIEKILFATVVSAMLAVGAWQFIEVVMDFSNQWPWLILALYWTITINETFTHRICGHFMFPVNTKSWLYKVLVWFGSVELSHGPVRESAIIHAAHHKFPDQGRADPVNWRHFWFGASYVMPFRGWGKGVVIPDVKNFLSKTYRRYQEIIDDPWTKFCERYQVLISIFTLTVLYFLLPIFLFKILLLGRFLMTVGMMLASIGHMKGVPGHYTHVTTTGNCYNNLFVHYLYLGIFSGLLQNNHHSMPNAVVLSRRWYEIDASAPIAYVLKYFLEKR